MALVNRDKDSSEQKEHHQLPLGAVPVTTTRQLLVAPYPMSIEAIKVAALGLSGAPQHKISVSRFVVGAGATTFDVVAAVAVPAVGTSGIFGMSLPAAGSSLLLLQAGDQVQVISSVANTAMADCTYELVLKALQDIKSFS